MIGTNVSFAQNLSPIEKITKDPKMDSALVEIYNSNLSGSGIPASVNPDFIEGNKVRVVIEFYTDNYTMLDNLEIKVETTHENTVQALVPIQNLEVIASNANVKFVRLPYQGDGGPVLAPEIIPEENSSPFYLSLFLLFVPIIAIVIIWRLRKKPDLTT
jgi:hypothetical protein